MIPMLINKTVGSNLRRMRELNKMTQLELGKELGVTAQSIARSEKGVDRVAADKLKQLADIFHVSVGSFYLED